MSARRRSSCGHLEELARQLAELKQRLAAPKDSPARPARATKGDVLALPVGQGRFAFAQVTGPGELALFAGAGAEGEAARIVGGEGPALRIPCSLSHVTRQWPVTTEASTAGGPVPAHPLRLRVGPLLALLADERVGRELRARGLRGGALPPPAYPRSPEQLLTLAREAAEGRLPAPGTVRLPDPPAQQTAARKEPKKERTPRVDWAELLRKTFDFESGQLHSFERFLGNVDSEEPTLPLCSFGTRQEADTWLSAHPRPPHGARVEIAGQSYSVGYSRDSGLRVLVRRPPLEELKRTEQPDDD
ncbi:hypothetical protein [Vitiosangium sp. GDMCC 1.1324]|uniref:hypothetical protein n=1 Tax=Vitiosangium sp. (strain GDMCC 1.1324) TaxID=2138576 RepID=UPI000D33E1ED|nr:hypothetical protein [Vitiosangium sp. GDMCC 1.1324]PTL80811.1 hypothetical protein DAT35_26075 [Vitiosangium sp. GDMCC 1.1324]